MHGDSGDYEAIQYLQAEYIDALDAGDVDRFVDVFADDATYLVGPETYDGHEGIRTFIRENVERRGAVLWHLLGNPRIDVSGDNATGSWHYLVLKTLTDAPDEWGAGRYEATYERRSRGWVITSLSATRVYTDTLE